MEASLGSVDAQVFFHILFKKSDLLRSFYKLFLHSLSTFYFLRKPFHNFIENYRAKIYTIQF